MVTTSTAPQTILMVHPTLGGPVHTTPRAFAQVWSKRGWQLVDLDDEQYLDEPVPGPVYDVITRDELDTFAAGLPGTFVPRPSGGSDGQAIVRQGTGFIFADAGGGFTALTRAAFAAITPDPAKLYVVTEA